MKRFKILLAIVFLLLLNAADLQAKEGDNGYDGGISSGQSQTTSKTSSEYEYQEVVFITGKPIVLKGKLTVKRKASKETETVTYTYTASDANNNSLKRNIAFQTKNSIKDNGQTIKETQISGKPTETLVIDGKSYVLDTYSLAKSSLVDSKPAVDYFAGNLNGKKVYKLKDGNTTITDTIKNQFYGYTQHWSNSEVQIIDHFIESETLNNSKLSWSGSAKVKLSSIMTTQFKYAKNFPEEISFDGGYVQSQNIVSKLNYRSSMPEFIKDIPTDIINEKTGSLKIETFPNEKRLIAPDLSSIRAHWAQEYISKLYGLEIYDEPTTLFMPNQYMSRGEFARALGKTINVVNNTVSTKKTKLKVTSLYMDVQTTDPNFAYIQELTSKKVLSGYDDGNFYPYETITRVQAVASFVKMLGLEGISKDEYPVTTFNDNDEIPSWALRSVYAAQRIGIVKGDENYFRPNQYMTKAEAAAFINRCIDYMRKDLAKSYSDKILNFN